MVVVVVVVVVIVVIIVTVVVAAAVTNWWLWWCGFDYDDCCVDARDDNDYANNDIEVDYYDDVDEGSYRT